MCGDVGCRDGMCDLMRNVMLWECDGCCGVICVVVCVVKIFWCVLMIGVCVRGWDGVGGGVVWGVEGGRVLIRGRDVVRGV